MRARIENLSYLPTTVAVAMKFVELGKDPEAGPPEYAKVIASDSSLCSKLLALANSSWFGVRHRVTKVQVAVNLLGVGTVRTLAISYCATGLHNELRLTPQESRMFWSASLCKATAARCLAELHDPRLGEEAFVMGLFQDFAVPVMYAAAKDAMRELLTNGGVESQARLQRERALFRLDHAELGRMVAQKLALPELFVDAVAFHHNQARLAEFVGQPVLARAAYVAGLFPHHLDQWCPQDAEEMRRFIAAQAPVSPEQYLETVQREFHAIYGYFEHGKEVLPNLTELLEAATREVADHTTRLVGTVQELMQQAVTTGRALNDMARQRADVEKSARSDPLTGALNRRGFTERAGEMLSRAARYGVGLALAYFDVDHFKKHNDTHGHAHGDQVLRNVVRHLRNNCRQHDALGRLGGDEFVLLLDDCDAAGAEAVVQRIRESIAGDRIHLAEAQDAPGVPATVSVGVAWVRPVPRPITLQELLGAADAQMYRAKRAGGNRVMALVVNTAAAA